MLIEAQAVNATQATWKPPPTQTVRSVETVEVQRVTFLRGLGVPDSICREVVQYWRDGELLAEVDPR